MQRAALFTARRACQAAPNCVAAGSRAASNSAAGTLYNVVFKKNVTYISYILVGAIVLDSIYGSTLDGVFNGINSGVRTCCFFLVENSGAVVVACLFRRLCIAMQCNE